jgi:hypothetical protein
MADRLDPKTRAKLARIIEATIVGDERCMVGRFVFMDEPPCEEHGNHLLGSDGEASEMVMRFCEPHMQLVIAAGYITDPNMDRDEWERYRRR